MYYLRFLEFDEKRDCHIGRASIDGDKPFDKRYNLNSCIHKANKEFKKFLAENPKKPRVSGYAIYRPSRDNDKDICVGFKYVHIKEYIKKNVVLFETGDCTE